jgi:hypothetical protein
MITSQVSLMVQNHYLDRDRFCTVEYEETSSVTGRGINFFTNSSGAHVTNSSFHVMDKCVGAVEMPNSPTPEFRRALDGTQVFRISSTCTYVYMFSNSFLSSLV